MTPGIVGSTRKRSPKEGNDARNREETKEKVIKRGE
jgi:hypothetical protein